MAVVDQGRQSRRYIQHCRIAARWGVATFVDDPKNLFHGLRAIDVVEAILSSVQFDDPEQFGDRFGELSHDDE